MYAQGTVVSFEDRMVYTTQSLYLIKALMNYRGRKLSKGAVSMLYGKCHQKGKCRAASF